MASDWRDTFPAKGVVEVLVGRLERIRGSIEGRDFSDAQRALRRWDGHIDLTGIPEEEWSALGLELNTALSHVKAKDASLALGAIDRALALLTH